MEELRFNIEISTDKEKVWDTLWQDETFREWAGLIDSGTHIVGDLTEGNEVQFISENGYGVTSLVKKLVPNELMVFNHAADTQDSGEREREKQWTGGKESYALTEKDGVTTLDAAFDVPSELKELFEKLYPKALARVKELAETKTP